MTRMAPNRPPKFGPRAALLRTFNHVPGFRLYVRLGSVSEMLPQKTRPRRHVRYGPQMSGVPVPVSACWSSTNRHLITGSFRVFSKYQCSRRFRAHRPLRCPGSGPCFPASGGPAAAERHGGSWFSGRSARPWCVGENVSRIRPGPGQYWRSSLRRSAHTAASKCAQPGYVGS
jgi:hypothetical protein